MSNSGVEVTGTDEIIRNIERLGLNVKKETSKALKAGAEIVVEELEQRAPYDPQGDIHMREHVVSSSVRTDRETGGKYIVVGFPKGIKHRVHVVEFGTINQAPQAFMSTTIEKTKSDVRDAILSSLRGALR